MSGDEAVYRQCGSHYCNGASQSMYLKGFELKQSQPLYRLTNSEENH